MTPTLHELTEDYLAFSDMLEATEDPDAEPAITRALAEIRGSFLTKTDNILALIKEYELHAENSAVEADRIKRRGKVSEAKAEWLRNYLTQQLVLLDQQHVKTPRFTANVVRTHSVEVTDETAVPGRFKKIVVSTKVDKVAIRNAIERDGEEVGGARLVENEHLRIT